MKTLLDDSQIEQLRNAFAPIKTASPKHLDTFRALYAKLNDEQLMQIVKAKINFVSILARNEAWRRNIEVA